jgi:hypothetical protein
MPEKTTEKSPFVERVPELSNKKWGGMAPKDAEALVADVLKAGKPAVSQLIDGLQEVDNGSDWKERLVLHMLVTQTSVPARREEQAIVGEALLAAALSDRPATVRSFLVQQLRLIADAAMAGKLAPLLQDQDPLVLDAVTMTMGSIGKGAEQVLREAMKGAEGHAKEAIELALNQIG